MKKQLQQYRQQLQQQQQQPAGEPPRMGASKGNDQWKSPSLLEEDALEKEELRRRRLETCKKVAKDLAKKAVLYGVMAAYAVLGGYAFVALEQTNEKELCLDNENLYDQMESTAAQSLWKMSRSFLDSDEQDSQRELIQGQMDAFRDDVLMLNYDGRNCSMLGTANGTTYNWNLASGLLFSVTIFTTVGYGNITPQTTWGRLVCIAYAMFGIPLMFVCLASIGEILGDVFRFVYTKICCLGACQRPHSPPRRRPNPLQGTAAAASQQPSAADDTRDTWTKRLVVDDVEEDEEGDEDEDEVSIPITVTLLVIAGYIGLGTIMFANWEGWDALKAAYYCFITVSTIGFGDVVPGFSPNDSGAGLKMIVAALYLLFGMSLMSMGFDLIQYEMKNRVPRSRSDPTPSVAGKDDPSSLAPPGNRGVPPPPTGQPAAAWPDANWANDQASMQMTSATDGVKKRPSYALGKELEMMPTEAMPLQYPAAKLDLKMAHKIA